MPRPACLRKRGVRRRLCRRAADDPVPAMLSHGQVGGARGRLDPQPGRRGQPGPNPRRPRLLDGPGLGRLPLLQARHEPARGFRHLAVAPRPRERRLSGRSQGPVPTQGPHAAGAVESQLRQGHADLHDELAVLGERGRLHGRPDGHRGDQVAPAERHERAVHALGGDVRSARAVGRPAPVPEDVSRRLRLRAVLVRLRGADALCQIGQRPRPHPVFAGDPRPVRRRGELRRPLHRPLHGVDGEDEALGRHDRRVHHRPRHPPGRAGLRAETAGPAELPGDAPAADHSAPRAEHGGGARRRVGLGRRFRLDLLPHAGNRRPGPDGRTKRLGAGHG